MDNEIKERLDEMETIGLELSGMREVIQLLENEHHKEIRGDVFGFLDGSLQRYADRILKDTAELKCMMGEP